MDLQSQMTRPYGQDQGEDPLRVHHPEEEEHHEKGASKVLKKVKEKAKKIKNSLTKHGHGHEHDQDVDEEEDEYEENDPEVHGAPVYESFAVRGGVTGHPESLSHHKETNVPAPEEIVPPGTKVFPVVSSDYTRPVEAEPLYAHEAVTHPTRTSDTWDKEDRTSQPLRVFDMSEREESREAHHMPMDTRASLLSSTEDVTRTFAPGEDEYLGGQRKVNVERPKGLEEDPAGPGGGSSYLSGVANYESKVTDPTKQGGGEAGVPGIVDRMKLTDEAAHRKSGRDFERELPIRSHEFGLNNESPSLGEDFPARNQFEHKTESGVDTNSPTGFGSELRARPGEEAGKDSPTGLGSGTIAGLGELPEKTYEYGIGKTGREGYFGESESGKETTGDDVKVETGLGRDLPTGTHDQFSPELSRPKERNDFDSKAQESRDEDTQGLKPSTYTEKIVSATSVITDKAIAAKNAVASKLGYSGKTTVPGQHGSLVGEETPKSATGYGQKVAGTVAEKLTPVYEKVKETGSTVVAKLPLSGGGSGVETQQGVDKGVSTRDYLAEKLKPGEEDKALSEVIAEKLHLGGGGGGEKKTTTTKEVEVTVEKIPSERIPEEMKHSEAIVEAEKGDGGGGMVGKLKGAVTSWLGGTTEEVKPKASESVEESSQSLGSTVGTMGFSDSGGAVSTHRGLQGSGN